MDDKKTYKAMLSVSRFTTGGNRAYFGSKVAQSAGVTIRLSECEETRNNGCDFFFPRKVLAEVELTTLQFADLVTNLNTTGTPVTLTRFGNENIERPTMETLDPIGKIAIDAGKADDRVKHRVGSAIEKLKESLNTGKQVSTKVAKGILETLELALEQYDDDRKFYKEQAQEEISKMLSEAKMAFDGHVTTRVLELGFKETPVALPLPN